MNRLRPNTRIRPIRPYWSRTKLLTVVVGSGFALFLMGTAWLQRSEPRSIELDPVGPYRWASSTGPIEVANGDAAVVAYQPSWLLFGPDTIGPADGLGDTPVGLACRTAFPCRAPSRVEVPTATRVEVESTGGDVSVLRFDGDLTVVTAGGSDVFLGPVAGSLAVTTGPGDVLGFGLTADEVDVETTSGIIELNFATRPRRVVVRSGSEPVTIGLPQGDYAVSVRGGSSIAINVGQVATADSEILVQARGPVRIDPTK